MSGAGAPPDPVRIERIKLLASALNSAALSAFTVGVVAPTAAVFYGAQPTVVPLRVLAVGILFWFSAATLLHLAAQRILGRLR